MKTFIVEFSTQVEVSLEKADTEAIIAEAKRLFKRKLRSRSKYRVDATELFHTLIIKEGKL